MSSKTESPQTKSGTRIAVLGAGIIGLCAAWELADRGAEVVIFDPKAPGQGASWAAAGMLAPAFESGHRSGTHPDLATLCLAGAAKWQDFATRLQGFTSQPIG